MTNFKTTKRALVSSVLALVMCFSMLLGTTFAWFTDSVTSGGNIIQTGNLDIELEYYNGTVWKSVEGADDIISGGLWEPGYTDVAYLRLRNAGSLDLKYQLGVEITETEGVNRAGETFKLSDYIYFDVIEGVDGQTSAYATRDAALAAVTEVKLISAGYSKADKLAAGSDYLYLAMVVYMPTSVGNEACHNGTDIPKIDMTVSILATQLNSESDSFGNQYDKDAVYADAYVTNADELVEAIAKGGVVALMNDIELSDSVAVETDATIDLNGCTVTNTTTTPFVVGQESAVVFTVKDGSADGTGEIVASHNYTNSNDAVCPIVVYYGEFVLESGTLTGYAGVRGKENKTDKITIKGGTINADNIGVYARTAMISIEGGTINADYGVTAQGTIYISGGIINAKYYGYSSSGNYDNTTVVISGDAVINSEYMGIYWPSGGSLTINGGTITGETGVHFKSGTLNITGGTLIGTGAKKDYSFYDNGSVNTGDALMIENVGFLPGETSGYEAITSVSITGGTFRSTNSYAVSSYDAGVDDAVDAVTGFIKGGTYSSDVSDLVADGYSATESNGVWTVAANN